MTLKNWQMTVICQFFKVISDKLIEMGPTNGKFAALWECTILDEGGPKTR